MLESLKKQVVEYAVQAEKKRLCQQGSGNFSIRDPKTGYICVTPSGVDRAELSFHDIIVMNLNAEVIESESGGLRPTSESLMHIQAYKSRPDINAVVHTHSRFATAFAILNKSIPAVVYETTILNCKNGYIPVAPYGRPGTSALSNSIINPLKISDATLLQSHGTLAVGHTLKEALLKISYVEEFAEIYYYSLTIAGKEPPVVPISELQNWAYPKEITLLDKNIRTSK
ncbi:class II aldolase/adducin family protein [Pectinatus frisingensis]|uniref:class II aldolase/adducin family protein n=1 Tax=Pectinatus frisingensis TaxID=865 RepID=UPI003D80045E